MKFWQKGGLVGITIAILIVIYLYAFACSPLYPTLGGEKCTNLVEQNISWVLFYGYFYPVYILSEFFSIENMDLPEAFVGIFPGVYYIVLLGLVGSIVGWVVGKIKSNT